MSSILRVVPREEYLLPGHAACAGCPATIALRHVLKALGGRAVLVIPASCSSIIGGPMPRSAMKVPVFHVAFAASAATASGVAEALEKRGVRDVNVVVWAGDGGTADIGMAGLSGAAERGNNVLYICYDNEAYMNTGIQRSGSTPYAAWTTTTVRGKREWKKNVALIMLAHRIPYVATASIAYPVDLISKVRKAASTRGFKYIHIHAPCPIGWRFDTSKTVEVARKAVQTGMWVLWEAENGKVRLSPPSVNVLKRGRRPIREYLELQGRYRHVTEEDVRILEEFVEREWEYIRTLVET